MIVLSATDITRAYGTDVILDHISFHVNEGDRVGIVGANGAGKSTLLDILGGVSEPDEGQFFLSSDVTVGYLHQNDDFEDDCTLREEVHKIYERFERAEKEINTLTQDIAQMAADGKTDTDEYKRIMQRYGNLQDQFERDGGFSYKSEMRGILNSMAFGEEYYDNPISSLSGGERTRLALACLLMRKPDVLMLDEPTNHLDIGMLNWLEQFLRNYKGTVIMVSHDRYFLDQLCTRIFEVAHHHLTCYDGNYTEYAQKKKQQRESDMRSYKKQQEEIRRQEDIIRKFKERGTEHLAKRAASREKKLAHMEVLERPESEGASLNVHFRQDYETGNDVLLGEDVGEAFRTEEGVRRLFQHADFDIKKGERICIVGPNGIGKTTLLRLMIGEIRPTEGKIRIGRNVKFGYYDQRQEQLHGDKTVLDEVHDSYRLYKESEIRNFLGRFLFRGDQVFTKVGSLSGGEKARLALLKLMMSGSNVLMLDEPTNHLDIESKEIFEEALREFPGTIVAVSHDRYFLNQIATKIYELGPSGITKYEGGYDYYEEKKEETSSGKQYLNQMRDLVGEAESERRQAFGEQNGKDGQSGEDSLPDQPLSSEEERALKKKRQAEERRKQRKIEQLESRIAELEDEIEEIQQKMCDPKILSNSKKLTELDNKQKDAQTELDQAYEEWGQLEE